MAVHVIFIPRLGIDMHPGVKPVGIKNYLTLTLFVRHFDHIDYVDRHNSSNPLEWPKA